MWYNGGMTTTLSIITCTCHMASPTRPMWDVVRADGTRYGHYANRDYAEDVLDRQAARIKRPATPEGGSGRWTARGLGIIR